MQNRISILLPNHPSTALAPWLTDYHGNTSDQLPLKEGHLGPVVEFLNIPPEFGLPDDLNQEEDDGDGEDVVNGSDEEGSDEESGSEIEGSEEDGDEDDEEDGDEDDDDDDDKDGDNDGHEEKGDDDEDDEEDGDEDDDDDEEDGDNDGEEKGDDEDDDENYNRVDLTLRSLGLLSINYGCFVNGEWKGTGPLISSICPSNNQVININKNTSI